MVKNAKIISPDTKGIKDWDKDSLGIIIRAMENSFKGQIYDLKSGDKFTTTGKLKIASGTWYEKAGVVSFMTDDYKQATWFFKNNKIEIGRDSSLIAMLELGVDSSYMQLTLKPAPGQAVKTDK